jgi:hypothetical protein
VTKPKPVSQLEGNIMKKLTLLFAIATIVCVSACQPIQLTLPAAAQNQPQQPVVYQTQPQMQQTSYQPQQQQYYQPQPQQQQQMQPQQQPQQYYQQPQQQQPVLSYTVNPNQPVQPTMQNTSYSPATTGGLPIQPKNVGKLQGCDIFEMSLDVGPVTVARCPGPNGQPSFTQISSASTQVGKIVFNDDGPKLTGESEKTVRKTIEDQIYASVKHKVEDKLMSDFSENSEAKGETDSRTVVAVNTK